MLLKLVGEGDNLCTNEGFTILILYLSRALKWWINEQSKDWEFIINRHVKYSCF